MTRPARRTVPSRPRHRRAGTVLVCALTFVASACAVSLDEVGAGPETVERAADDAACEVTESAVGADRTHLDPAGAPPPQELYEQRPPAAGPHFAEWLDPGVYEGEIEERAAVHNLEHGAVVVWHDPALDDDQLTELRGWAERRNAAGLLDTRTGAGIIVAPFADAPLTAPIAFRAWEVAGDCAAFSEVVADEFVRTHFGPAGTAPERNLAPDPADVLGRTEAI
ncbi:DUF3105 domain-containing protein [Nitriliruptoraceae bacterium ZYF776]|nr:DUF3105 domain-containing protein [Profundirhabdus halotolerans]